jgi:putative membrane protein
MSMGVADVIPGVSGGSVAFITGIYSEMVHALRSIDREAFELVTKKRFSDCWTKINGNFLVALFAGIITSLLTIARLMTHLQTKYPILVWSFVFGLILVSALLVLRDIKKWNVGVVAAFFFGALVSYGITLLSPAQTPPSIWFIFLTGVLSVSALLIPGLSGAFILLLLGKYQYMVNALISFNVVVILVFLGGCMVGLIGFSRILTWTLDNYHSATVALLTGFMLGSLNKVWPWREVLEYVTNSRGDQVPAFDRSILPWHYFATTGKDPQVFQAILMMAISVFIVVLFVKIAARLKTKI